MKSVVAKQQQNKPMRLASILLVVALATCCMVGGTFAKYVTEASASDSARVAKWGVSVTASGDLFGTTYKTTENTVGDDGKNESLSVISSENVDKSNDDVVAPGTKNDTGISYTLSGTPETAVSVKFEVAGKDETDPVDVFLAAGTYKNYTGIDEESFTVPKGGYYPIKYYLKQEKGSTTKYLTLGSDDSDKQTITEVSTDGENKSIASLSDLKTILVLLNASYDANTDLSSKIGTLTLTWEWDFDANGVGTNDEADTLLGQLANDSTIAAKLSSDTYTALKNTGNTPDYNLTPSIKITVTVTQVD